MCGAPVPLSRRRPCKPPLPWQCGSRSGASGPLRPGAHRPTALRERLAAREGPPLLSSRARQPLGPQGVSRAPGPAALPVRLDPRVLASDPRLRGLRVGKSSLLAPPCLEAAVASRRRFAAPAHPIVTRRRGRAERGPGRAWAAGGRATRVGRERRHHGRPHAHPGQVPLAAQRRAVEARGRRLKGQKTPTARRSVADTSPSGTLGARSPAAPTTSTTETTVVGAPAGRGGGGAPPPPPRPPLSEEGEGKRGGEGAGRRRTWGVGGGWALRYRSGGRDRLSTKVGEGVSGERGVFYSL